MQVVNCTTPAQYFHLLRRQMRGGADRRGVRKPLIVMAPKSLLRHAKVISTVEDLTTGHFSPVLDDATVADPSAIRKILVCNGKIYYELLAGREQRKSSDETAAHTAIIRMEQLYPFPQFEFEQVLQRYPKASGVVWVQEEPHNMGAWSFVRTHIVPILRAQGREIGYSGRPDSASTAPGSSKRHAQEQADLIAHAFDPPVITPRARRRLVRRLKGRSS